MHILLVRFSSMGDVVLTTATINWLHSLFGKDLTVSFVTSHEFTALLTGHPGVKNVVGFDRKNGEKWKDLLKKIDLIDEQNPIDLILDLHATLRSLRLRFSYWTIPALTVDKRRWERFLLTKLPITTLKKKFPLEPQVIRILKDLESLFQDTRAVRRTADFRNGPHGELTSLGGSKQNSLAVPYIVLAPSASFIYKRWHIDSYLELVRSLLEKTSLHFVVLAGPTDHFCAVFDNLNSERVHNLQGKTSLSESMSWLKGAKLTIGNDSGINHISEAYGVPCITIFGPTDPRFGFAPHGRDSVTLSKELWCKPCSTTGSKDCHRDRHYCMEEIKVKEVLDASLLILERNP
jgi:ADP-heptose:LPS heptosyltransferase